MYGSFAEKDEEWGAPVPSSRQMLGLLASLTIFWNAIIGPGFLSLPKLYNDSGFVIPTLLLTVGFVLAALATVVRSETVALMPGNSDFSRIVEFCDPALKHVGKRAFYISHLLFYVASLSIVIASIVLVAEAADVLISRVFGRSYAWTLAGEQPGRILVWSLDNCRQNEVCKPFFTGHQVQSNLFVSLGYVIAFATLSPISTDKLSEGMSLQYMSLIAMGIAVPVFLTRDVLRCVHGHVTLATLSTGPRGLDSSGVVLFNLMYGIFVSTWLCEKQPAVSVRRVVYGSSVTSCLVMVAYGAVTAAASRDIPVDGLLASTERGTPLIAFAAAIFFGLFVIASGIPVACVMARHNLVSSPIHLVNENVANFLTFSLPWATAWVFAAPIAYKALLNFTGLFVVSWLALWMPFFLLLAHLDPLPQDGSYLRWFLRQLVAPCDPETETVLNPLPPRLHPYSRRVYAACLLFIAGWIFIALSSYVVWFLAILISDSESVKGHFK